jgi:hypothetical protein
MAGKKPGDNQYVSEAFIDLVRGKQIRWNASTIPQPVNAPVPAPHAMFGVK